MNMSHVVVSMICEPLTGQPIGVCVNENLPTPCLLIAS